MIIMAACTMSYVAPLMASSNRCMCYLVVAKHISLFAGIEMLQLITWHILQDYTRRGAFLLYQLTLNRKLCSYSIDWISVNMLPCYIRSELSHFHPLIPIWVTWVTCMSLSEKYSCIVCWIGMPPWCPTNLWDNISHRQLHQRICFTKQVCCRN